MIHFLHVNNFIKQISNLLFSLYAYSKKKENNETFCHQEKYIHAFLKQYIFSIALHCIYLKDKLTLLESMIYGEH